MSPVVLGEPDGEINLAIQIRINGQRLVLDAWAPIERPDVTRAAIGEAARSTSTGCASPQPLVVDVLDMPAPVLHYWQHLHLPMSRIPVVGALVHASTRVSSRTWRPRFVETTEGFAANLDSVLDRLVTTDEEA